MSRRTSRRESGAALLVAMLLLVLMGAIGLATLETAMHDRQVAGLGNRSATAFYSAEAGGAEGRRLIRTVTRRGDTPAFPTQGAPTSLGDSSLHPYGQPSYYGDPRVANPIRYVGDGGLYAQGGNLRLGGQKFVKTLWQINVIGEAGSGAAACVENVQTKILRKGY